MTTSNFLERHKLSDAYAHQAQRFFDPLCSQLIQHQQQAGRPIIVGINGCQGSGKTTLADYLVMQLQAQGQASIALSIDDFYLSQSARHQLAECVHPLLATRGVPGTHNVGVAITTLQSLCRTGSCVIPQFAKAIDDVLPATQWPTVDCPQAIIVLEGWCVGIPNQNDDELIQPINTLESQQDSDGMWRNYVNQQLKTTYADLWKLLDYRVFLQAPSFDVVANWRYEQEDKLKQALGNTHESNQLMSRQQIDNFIAHYERLTRHAIRTMPALSDTVFILDSMRKIVLSNDS